MAGLDVWSAVRQSEPCSGSEPVKNERVRREGLLPIYSPGSGHCEGEEESLTRPFHLRNSARARTANTMQPHHFYFTLAVRPGRRTVWLPLIVRQSISLCRWNFTLQKCARNFIYDRVVNAALKKWKLTAPPRALWAKNLTLGVRRLPDAGSPNFLKAIEMPFFNKFCQRLCWILSDFYISTPIATAFSPDFYNDGIASYWFE